MHEPTRLVFGKEIVRLAAEKDFIICNADTKNCGFENFGKLYPNREFSIGIAEQNLIATASGLASCGHKVFVSTYAVFASLRACEQIRTYVCHTKFNVTILGTHVGLQTGKDGASHIAVEDISIMRALPNMTIIEPSDNVAAVKAARIAVDFTGPLYVRLHFGPSPIIHDPDKYEMILGKANVIREYGNDLTFMVSGILLSKVIEAADILREQGINATILEFHTLKPIDEQAIIDAAVKTRAIVTVEDHTILGGLGSMVSEIVSENIPTIVKRIGIRDRFGESGDPELQYAKNKMTVKDMVEAAKYVVSHKA